MVYWKVNVKEWKTISSHSITGFYKFFPFYTPRVLSVWNLYCCNIVLYIYLLSFWFRVCQHYSNQDHACLFDIQFVHKLFSRTQMINFLLTLILFTVSYRVPSNQASFIRHLSQFVLRSVPFNVNLDGVELK